MARTKKKSNALAYPLARVGDPYVTKDNRVIQPDFAEQDVEQKAPPKPSKSFQATKQRVLDELPATSEVLKGVACVVFFTVLGIGDREIADALKITLSDVRKVRSLPAYSECFDLMFAEFISVNSEVLEARIAAYAQDSLTNVAKIATNGKHEGNKLRANFDILDRGGIGVKNSVMRGGGMDALRIVVTEGGKEVSVDIGNVNPS